MKNIYICSSGDAYICLLYYSVMYKFRMEVICICWVFRLSVRIAMLNIDLVLHLFIWRCLCLHFVLHHHLQISYEGYLLLFSLSASARIATSDIELVWRTYRSVHLEMFKFAFCFTGSCTDFVWRLSASNLFRCIC